MTRPLSASELTSEHRPFCEREDARLGVLWAEGHSMSEIGRLMDRTKNSIVGRAHRLGLPKRASPIVRDGRPQTRNRPGKPKPVPRFHAGASLPPIERPVVAPVQPRADTPRPRPLAPAGPVPATALLPLQPTAPGRPGSGCQWPLWNNGRAPKPPVFCDAAPSRWGSAYCVVHRARAYSRQPSTEESADARRAGWLRRAEAAAA